MLALEGSAPENGTLALDERKVGLLEGEGHGGQLISAAKHRKKRSMFARLEESMAAAAYLLEKINAFGGNLWRSREFYMDSHHSPN